MADFCWDCTRDHLGMPPEKNDLSGLCTKEENDKGLYAHVLCEGCGPGQVDHTGKMIGKKRDSS